MRLTTAIAILSLVSSAESLSTGGQNHRRSRQQRGSTSLLPHAAAKASARASSPRSEVDSDIFAQAVENNNGKSKPRKKGVARPPLVDSALLRFLSKQKRLREENGNGVDNSLNAANEEVSDSQIVGNSYSLLSTIGQDQVRTEMGETNQRNDRPMNSTQQLDDAGDMSLQSSLKQNDSDLPLKADDSLDSWMGQFNRNRIAKVLMALGSVDELLADQAGECVQRYVLARMARRRVREFLKERDTMWEEGRAGPTMIERKVTSGITAQPEYGFSDVVDVMIEKGLTAKDVATILTHTPTIALMMPKRPEGSEGQALGGETIEETLQRSLSDLLCATLKLRKYDARKVLRNSPGLLTKRGSISANQVVAAMTKLGVSTSSIARDKAGLPTLLSRPPAALFRLIAFLGSDAIRMPINKIGPLIRRSVCLDVLDAVAPVARFQLDLKATTDLSPEGASESMPEAGILPAFVGRTIEQRKKLIDDTYERMSVTAWTLRNKVGTSDLGKVIAAYPNVLLLDASKQVLPVAEYLMEDLGIWEDDLARVLQLYPSLLGVPVAKMERVVDFIIAQGVVEENLASIFRSFPALLTLDIEKDMVPVIQFLRSIGIKNVGRFISRLPPILGYSVEQEMIPKWEFIRDIYTYPSFEASKFPAFFSYPMERIRARFEYLSDVKLLPISLIAPDLVLRYGDRDFSMKVAGDDDEGAAFARFLEDRQARLPGKRRGRTKRKKAP